MLKHSQREKGFTLVEIIAVLVILSVLASVAIPRYISLDESARQRAIDAGDTEHGVSVHFVTEEMDGGPIIAQERVPVLPDDTAEQLAARVLEREHQLYPAVVRWFADGRLQMNDNHALLDDTPLPPQGAEATP